MKRTIKRGTPKDYSFLDLVAPSYNRLRLTPELKLQEDPKLDLSVANNVNYNYENFLPYNNLAPSYEESIPNYEELNFQEQPDFQTGGELPKFTGGGTTGGNVQLNPTIEFYANEMYKKYGKVVITDNATNTTYFGGKDASGHWKLSQMEVLTGKGGSNTQNYKQNYKPRTLEELGKNNTNKITPIGVWHLKKAADLYGMPGLSFADDKWTSSLNGKVAMPAYHVTYKGSLESGVDRSKFYGNTNKKDNYASYGCVNCQKPDLQKLLNFVGNSGIGMVIDTRLSPEENTKYMSQNTPKTVITYKSKPVIPAIVKKEEAIVKKNPNIRKEQVIGGKPLEKPTDYNNRVAMPGFGANNENQSGIPVAVDYWNTPAPKIADNTAPAVNPPVAVNPPASSAITPTPPVVTPPISNPPTTNQGQNSSIALADNVNNLFSNLVQNNNTDQQSIFAAPQSYSNNQAVGLNSVNEFDWNKQQVIDPGGMEWTKKKAEEPWLKDGSKEHQYFLCAMQPGMCKKADIPGVPRTPLAYADVNSTDPELESIREEIYKTMDPDSTGVVKNALIFNVGNWTNRSKESFVESYNQYFNKTNNPKFKDLLGQYFDKVHQEAGYEIGPDGTKRWTSPTQNNINQNNESFADQQNLDQQRINNWNNRNTTQWDNTKITAIPTNIATDTENSNFNPFQFPRIGNPLNPQAVNKVGTPIVKRPSISTDQENGILASSLFGFPNFQTPLNPENVASVNRPDLGLNNLASLLGNNIQQSTPPTSQVANTQNGVVQQPINNQVVASQPLYTDKDWMTNMFGQEEKRGGFDIATGKSKGLSNFGYNYPLGYKLDETTGSPTLGKVISKKDGSLYNNSGIFNDAPTDLNQAITRYSTEYLPLVSDLPLGVRERAGHFLYNTSRDPRVYMLKSYLDSKGTPWTDAQRKSLNKDIFSSDWTPETQKFFEEQWNANKAGIQGLPVDQQVNLLNQGKDFFYQNINRGAGESNENLRAYNATHKAMIDDWYKGQSYYNQPTVAQNTAVQTPPASVVQSPPATNIAGQIKAPANPFATSNMMRAPGDEDDAGSVFNFLNSQPATTAGTTTTQQPIGSNTGINTGTTTAGTNTGTINTTQNIGSPSNMMRVPGYMDNEEPIVSIDPLNPPYGVDPTTGVDPRKMEWLKDSVRNQMTELKDIQITPEKVEPQPNHYKPFAVNPFTTGLNIFNAGLNTIGGMRNMGRIREQEKLNSFITQQPEAIYPNKRMLYGDKSMFAEYGGEYSEGGMYPDGGPVYQPEENIGELIEYKKGGIYIKPENKGKFTAWADAHGMSVQEAASHVMANKEKYSSTTVKRANFAKNASKFKHADGGEPLVTGDIKDKGAGNILDYTAGEDRSYWNPISRYFSPLNKSFRQSGISGNQKDSMLNTMFGSGPVNYNVRPRTYDPTLVKDDYEMDNSVYTPATPAATPATNLSSTPYNFYFGDSAYSTYDTTGAQNFASKLGLPLNNNVYTYDQNTGGNRTWVTGADGKIYPNQQVYNSGDTSLGFNPGSFGLTKLSYGGHYIPQDVSYLAGKFVPSEIDLDLYKKGGMIKRADGSYSQRGLWDNIRANKGSGKKPTKEMLKQERKIKKSYKAGGEYMEGNEYEISGAEVERLRSLGYDIEMI